MLCSLDSGVSESQQQANRKVEQLGSRTREHNQPFVSTCPNLRSEHFGGSVFGSLGFSLSEPMTGSWKPALSPTAAELLFQ